jgi:hypothetical protein
MLQHFVPSTEQLDAMALDLQPIAHQLDERSLRNGALPMHVNV